jgi:hypothetical protein
MRAPFGPARLEIVTRAFLSATPDGGRITIWPLSYSWRAADKIRAARGSFVSGRSTGITRRMLLSVHRA